MIKTTITVEETSDKVWLLDVVSDKTRYQNESHRYLIFRNIDDAKKAMRDEIKALMRGTKIMLGDKWFDYDSLLGHVSPYDTDFKVYDGKEVIIYHHAHIYQRDVL